MVSDSEVTAADLQEAVVLILVVMEYGLGRADMRSYY